MSAWPSRISLAPGRYFKYCRKSLASDFLQYLKYRPGAKLILEGHADIRGEKDYNIKLSERRVERTKSYLVEKGVAADKLEVKAFGFEKNMTDADVKAQIEADPALDRKSVV